MTNLAAALVAFQADMPKVNKGKTAHVPTKTGGSYSYTYADLADVSAVATPVLTRHGLAFSARPRRTEQGDYELVGVLTHTSGEEKEGALPLHGRTAQEIGSSITYGRRYLLGCMTGIVTDDDDDGATATTTTERTRRQAPPPDPALVAQNRVLTAWVKAHGDSGVDPLPYIAADYANGHGGEDIRAASPEALDAYAATLEGLS